jgi:hypothetical protein
MVTRFTSLFEYTKLYPKNQKEYVQKEPLENLLYIFKESNQVLFSMWLVVDLIWGQLVIHLTQDLWHLPLTTTEPAIEFSPPGHMLLPKLPLTCVLVAVLNCFT